ncbi:MAG: hypothetical protein IRZ08_13170 [Frankia sp.]|nr:hypothetical protein [Frankia sp.]
MVTDVSPADWVVAGTIGDWGTIGSLLPAGFAAYARVLHPAGLGERAVSWAEVARGNGRVAHPAMEWAAIADSSRHPRGATQPGLWDAEPTQGSLPVPQAARLAHLLARHTTTADRCWFAVWDGFGALAVPTAGIPKVHLPGRDMVLLTGPLSAVTTSLAHPPWDQRASLWWPDDRAWCVATDVDLMSTYLGGSQGCVDDLTGDDQLEAMPVPLDQRVTWDSDEVNPLPPHPPS